MVSVALVAIGLALAVPSYRDMVEKRQLEQGAEQIAAFIGTAQTTASKNNRVVTVSYARSDDDDWCFGAVLGTTACDCNESVSSESDYCVIDGQRAILSSLSTNSLDLLKSINGDGAFSYDPLRGLFVDANDSLELGLRSPSEDYRLKLEVNAVGRITICSDGESHKVPGYGLCALAEVDATPITSEPIDGVPGYEEGEAL
jgi:Tfp pilus assembly protein FimT